MAGEWREATLAQLGQIVTGKTPSSSCADCFDGDIPFVTPTDFDGRRIIETTGRYLTERGAESVSGSRVPAHCVMLSCIGSDMGKAAIAGRDCVTNQQINSIVVEFGDDPLFVYYNLSTRKKEIRSFAGGSAQPILNKSAFGNLDIFLPPPEEQRAIAHILGTLDDKIELNRRMNETLEAMARALFKSWFVDFDPVRAKAEGRDPGLPKPLADLFPDSFEDSELGKIPKGWEVGTIDEATSLIIDYRGKTPKKLGREWSSSGISAISAKNIKKGQLVQKDAMNFVDRGLYNLWMKDKLKIGDILMTSEAPLGELFYLARNAEFCLSQRVFALRAADTKCFSTFLYYWLLSNACQERLKSRTTGTTVLGIRQSELRKVEILIPPLTIQEFLQDYLLRFLTKIACNEEESENLSAIRDTLLPKLIAGELRVNTKNYRQKSKP
jgi:type I restriction enzyme, S subunit